MQLHAKPILLQQQQMLQPLLLLLMLLSGCNIMQKCALTLR
jgi:hypothetical protein